MKEEGFEIVEKAISILKVSLKNIVSNKLLSDLTILGLIIGIISVILLVGIGTGATSNVTSSVQSLGTGTLTITVDSDSDTSLEYEDLDEFLKIPNVAMYAPYKTVSGTVSYGTTTSRGSQILATTPNYLSVMNLTISNGRLLSNIDLKNTSKVCLLGTDIVNTLFEDVDLEDIVGKQIKIDGDKYTVVGALTSAGSPMGNNVDSTLIIPFTTAKYLNGDTTINSLYVKVENEDMIDSTINSLENYLEKSKGISTDYFTVSSQSSMIDTM